VNVASRDEGFWQKTDFCLIVLLGSIRSGGFGAQVHNRAPYVRSGFYFRGVIDLHVLIEMVEVRYSMAG
jgi:hypothetical protein